MKQKYFLLLFVSVLLLWLDTAGAITVVVPEDITITEMNWQRTDILNSCNELMPPSDQYGVSFSSAGDSVHVFGSTTVDEYLIDGSAIGQGVKISAELGINELDWETGDCSWDDVRKCRVKITLNYGYAIEAFNAGCCGHSNVRIEDVFSSGWVDAVFSINQGLVTSSGFKSRSSIMTLESMPAIYAQIHTDACTRSMPAGHAPGPASYSGTLTVNNIKIEFLPMVVLNKNKVSFIGIVPDKFPTREVSVANYSSAPINITQLEIAEGPWAEKFDFVNKPALPLSIDSKNPETIPLKFFTKETGVFGAVLRIKTDNCLIPELLVTLTGTAFSDSPKDKVFVPVPIKEQLGTVVEFYIRLLGQGVLSNISTQTASGYTINFGDGSPFETNNTGFFTHAYGQGEWLAEISATDDGGGNVPADRISVVTGEQGVLGVSSNVLSIAEGGSKTITITGSTGGPYAIASYDTNVATAGLSNNLITANGVLQGTTFLSVTDTNDESVFIMADVRPTCPDDFNGDWDVDGADLVAYIADNAKISLDDLASDFGRTNCP